MFTIRTLSQYFTLVPVTELSDQDKLTLKLLNSVSADAESTQRGLSQDLGIALGMTNAYLKRCIKKGFIKVSQAPANRFKYYLTATGFLEKSRLTAEFLSQSFNLFRYGRSETTRLFDLCLSRGWRRVVLIGATDFAEIAILGTTEIDVEVAVHSLNGNQDGTYCGVPVVHDLSHAAQEWDAAIICDYADAPAAFRVAERHFSSERVLVPSILEVEYGQGGKQSFDLEDGVK